MTTKLPIQGSHSENHSFGSSPINQLLENPNAQDTPTENLPVAESSITYWVSHAGPCSKHHRTANTGHVQGVNTQTHVQNSKKSLVQSN